MDFADEDTDPAEVAPDATPLVRPRIIEHPDEFIRELTGITAPWTYAFGSVRPWFRGTARFSFSLEPSLLRYRPRNLAATENNLEGQFNQYAVRLIDRLPRSRLETLAIMQHHGFPTRLLDWTENAFAALYFAVKEHQYLNDPEDAVVWVLEPLRLAEMVRGDRQIPYGHDNLFGPPYGPVPFYPAHTSARLTPQRATFTLHPFRAQHALQKLALAEIASGRPSPLAALRISGRKRAFIRDAMMNAFGSGEFTYFPDLDGLARELRMREGLEGRG